MASLSIQLTALRLPVALGVHDFERKARQDVTVDIDLELGKHPERDSIEETAHYDELAALVQTVADRKHYDLIETLALDIATEVRALPNVAALTLRVTKTPRTVACEALSATVKL